MNNRRSTKQIGLHVKTNRTSFFIRKLYGLQLKIIINVLVWWQHESDIGNVALWWPFRHLPSH